MNAYGLSQDPPVYTLFSWIDSCFLTTLKNIFKTPFIETFTPKVFLNSALSAKNNIINKIQSDDVISERLKKSESEEQQNLRKQLQEKFNVKLKYSEEKTKTFKDYVSKIKKDESKIIDTYFFHINLIIAG